MNTYKSLVNKKSLSRKKLYTAVASTVAMSALIFTNSSWAENLLNLEEVIVTGTTGNSTVTKLESSISVTTLDREALDREQPLGTADLLETVPGFWVESSGGETNNNVAPRGLRGGEGFRYIGVQEDGLPVIYDGVWVDFYQRPDITIERMEAIRGGTSGIFTTNGPASLINFITRKPVAEDTLEVKVGAADYGMLRTDLYYSGAVTDDWNIGVGGFYRQSDGVRDTGFTADDGGQIRVDLNRELERGEITLSLKHLNDHTTFFSPIPVTNQDSPEGLAGVDPNHGTLLGTDIQKLNYKKVDGSEITRDLEDGQHTKLTTIGAKFNWEFESGWNMENTARYSQFDNDMYIMLNWDNSTLSQTASQRLEQQDVQDMMARFASDGAVEARYSEVATGQLLSNVDSMNGNGLVTTNYPLFSQYEAEQLANNLAFSFESDNNNITIGWLMAAVDADKLPVDQWEGQFLSDVRDNARRLDIVAVDDNEQVVGQLTDRGMLTYSPGWSVNDASGKSMSNSLYVNDEFQLTDNLRIDGGFRVEHLTLDSTAAGTVAHVPIAGAFDADGNDTDNIMANNYSDITSSEYYSHKKSYTETAWSVGFNYTFTDQLAVFGRYADAFEMPRLMDHGFNIGSGADATFNDVGKLNFVEIGSRYSGDKVGASATLFKTTFADLTERNITGADGTTANTTMDTETTGIEFEAVWQPVDMFSLELSGVFQDPTMENMPSEFSNREGNQIKRTPKTQLRLIPTLSFDWGNVFMVAHHVGDRYADGNNDFELPSYTTLDAGINFNPTDNLGFNLKGTNLTNEIGLTEGNPRSVNDIQSGFTNFFARPVLGRTYTLTASYSF